MVTTQKTFTTMVTITDYKERQKEDGSSFYVLQIEGGIDLVQSQTTGNYYATSKRAFIPTTFGEGMCSKLIGKELAGHIVKQECDPYEYTVKDTGEVLILEHKWMFVPETAATAKPVEKSSDELIPDFNSFVRKDVFETEFAN